MLIVRDTALTFAVMNFQCHKLIAKGDKQNNSDLKNFICNQYGGRVIKLEAIKMQFVCIFYHIC